MVYLFKQVGILIARDCSARKSLSDQIILNLQMGENNYKINNSLLMLLKHL